MALSPLRLRHIETSCRLAERRRHDGCPQLGRAGFGRTGLGRAERPPSLRRDTSRSRITQDRGTLDPLYTVGWDNQQCMRCVSTNPFGSLTRTTKT
jgi:hypothetical protein